MPQATLVTTSALSQVPNNLGSGVDVGAASASLVTPERGATFYRSLLESPAAVNRTDISSVGRTTEDDEASVFELLQSVDNWQSLKTFVRYNSTSQLRNNDAGDGDDGDVVRLADMTPPPSPSASCRRWRAQAGLPMWGPTQPP